MSSIIPYDPLQKLHDTINSYFTDILLIIIFVGVVYGFYKIWRKV
jgi:hypothetical protein